MEKQSNTVEYQKQLREKRNAIKTDEELFNFLKEIINSETSKDQAKSPINVIEASSAVAFYLAIKFNLTPFLFDYVKWGLLYNTGYKDNKCGLRIFDYDQLLFPQYEPKFEKSIPENVWKKVQKLAKGMYDYQKNPKIPVNKRVSNEYMEHWKKIIDGIPPFGFTIRKSDKDEEETNSDK